ncbi:MAG: hotdog fold thioesterase [Melioribacteraceae bacterium]|nr:hotdog fold thioesterase [Melioribacteraceae bacterium]MCF8356538.1 hotdog fold thioesterase [Melioribacteraceae bacterium]MCF8393276.1 hotdog fold thioesterase [Melioribacteraceae bacterium]MCF8417577.1 hotdog fold thioesterase [Melioribacteraceae bacterium]
MNKQELAEKVVSKMIEKDEFSRWLGLEVIDIKPGYSKLSMRIRKEMLNGFHTCHGGVTMSFADSALAFASNNHNRVAVALEVSIAYPAPVYEGDVLTAEAIEQSKGNSVGVYNIIITNQADVKVGIFRGTVYRTKKEHVKVEEKE